MKYFALTIFVLHTVFELLFGIGIFMSGASASQSAEQIAAQSTETTISFRFMGAALTALGLLGAIIIFGPGVRSVTARYVAAALAVFHGFGTLGSLYTAAPGFEAYSAPLALGAVILHGLLAIGFIIIALRSSEAKLLSTLP